MRIAAIVWCSAIPGLQVYLFRRIRDDLVKNHMEGPKGFRSLLASWVAAGWCEIVEDEIRFWNGSKIYLCHCKDEKDIYKYQGAEIHVLLVDELTHFTEVMYRFLRNRVRMVGIVIPPQYAGMFPRILCGANPGNIGHLWVKSTFVIAAVPMTVRRVEAAEGGMRRQYIPARLDDNPSMADDDPGYEARLEGLGSETLVRAMRWGDWDVIEGAFFDCWRNDLHVVPPFTIPNDWTRFRSGDWGSYRPFSVGWWAIAGDDYRLGTDGLPFVHDTGARNGVDQGGRHNNRTIPRGALVRYREWYGASSPNVGLKLTAEQVGDGIAEREKSDKRLIYGVLDPSAFKEDGGPSIAERINGQLLKAKLPTFHEADNARIAQRGAMGGWDQMRSRMVGNGERPMIYTFSTCRDSIRTIPALQHDQTRPEDVDTEAEDHAGDEWRYACMSRPYIRPKPEAEKAKFPSGYAPKVSAAEPGDWRSY